MRKVFGIEIYNPNKKRFKTALSKKQHDSIIQNIPLSQSSINFGKVIFFNTLVQKSLVGLIVCLLPYIFRVFYRLPGEYNVWLLWFLL